MTVGLLSGSRPGDLGVRGGRLKPPPQTPNAVHSQAPGGYHAIEPLRYKGHRDDAMLALLDIVHASPRTTVVARTEDYLHAEYASALFGFVDDVEFYLPFGEKVIHVRSASRVGYSDLGVNRKRIESIRGELARRGA